MSTYEIWINLQCVCIQQHNETFRLACKRDLPAVRYQRLACFLLLLQLSWLGPDFTSSCRAVRMNYRFLEICVFGMYIVICSYVCVRVCMWTGNVVNRDVLVIREALCSLWVRKGGLFPKQAGESEGAQSHQICRTLYVFISFFIFCIFFFCKCRTSILRANRNWKPFEGCPMCGCFEGKPFTRKRGLLPYFTSPWWFIQKSKGQVLQSGPLNTVHTYNMQNVPLLIPIHLHQDICQSEISLDSLIGGLSVGQSGFPAPCLDQEIIFRVFFPSFDCFT